MGELTRPTGTTGLTIRASCLFPSAGMDTRSLTVVLVSRHRGGTITYLGKEHRPHLKWTEALRLTDLESFSTVRHGVWSSTSPLKKSHRVNKDGETLHYFPEKVGEPEHIQIRSLSLVKTVHFSVTGSAMWTCAQDTHR